MPQRELLEELCSSEVANTIKQNQLSWSFQNALEKDWTKMEQEPPDSLDKQGWTRKLPVTPGSTCSLIVDRTQRRYNISSPSHTVKRLTRYALPILLDEWGEQVIDASKYRRAAEELSTFVSANPDFYSMTIEDKRVNLDTGRTNNGQEHWRVIWYQKRTIATIADALSMKEADILRRVIFEAGKELEMRSQHKNIRKFSSAIDDYVNKRVSEIKRPVRGIVVEALLSDTGLDAAEHCMREYPRVWEEFQHVAGVVEKNESDGFLSSFDI